MFQMFLIFYNSVILVIRVVMFAPPRKVYICKSDCFNCQHVTMQVMFPSTQLGTGENLTLTKTISVTEYLNYETGQLMFYHGFHKPF